MLLAALKGDSQAQDIIAPTYLGCRWNGVCRGSHGGSNQKMRRMWVLFVFFLIMQGIFIL